MNVDFVKIEKYCKKKANKNNYNAVDLGADHGTLSTDHPIMPSRSPHIAWTMFCFIIPEYNDNTS